MSKLFPRGFRVRYWHRHLRRDVFIAIGLVPVVVFLITIVFRLLAIMPPSKGLVSFTKALVTQVDWLAFVNSLLPGLYLTLIAMVVLVLGKLLVLEDLSISRVLGDYFSLRKVI